MSSIGNQDMGKTFTKRNVQSARAAHAINGGPFGGAAPAAGQKVANPTNDAPPMYTLDDARDSALGTNQAHVHMGRR